MAQSKRTAASYIAEQRNTKPLSTAMQQWVQANRSKLEKNATAKQKAIFKKYDQMKKAGMLAAKPATKPKVTKKVASTAAAKKPVAKKPSSKRHALMQPGKKEKVTDSTDYVKSQPKLKSQPKTSKPNRRGRKTKDSRVSGLAKNLREMLADQRKRRAAARGAFRKTYK